MVAKNAAEELLELIGSWRHDVKGANETVATQRGTAPQLNEELWRNELTAAGLLLAIEDFVDARGEREMYAPLFNDLRRFIFMPEHNWQQAAAKFAPSARLGLHQLGQIMERSAARTLHLDATELQALQDSLDECLEILDPVTVADDEGLQYLREVLRRLKEALEGGDVDITLVRDQAYAAVGLALLSHESLPGEKRERFFQKLFSVVFTFGTGTATGASGNVLSTAITDFLQIGG